MFSFLLLSNDMKIRISFITSEGKKIHRNECDEDRFTRNMNANEKKKKKKHIDTCGTQLFAHLIKFLL